MSIRFWLFLLVWSRASFMLLCRGDLHEWLEETLDLDLHRRPDLSYKIRHDGAQLSNAVVYEKTQQHYKAQTQSFAMELGIIELFEYMDMLRSVDEKGVEHMIRNRIQRERLLFSPADSEELNKELSGEDDDRENDLYSYKYLHMNHNDHTDQGSSQSKTSTPTPRRSPSMDIGIEVPTPFAAHRLLTTYTRTPASEVQALKAIYDATSGSNWTIPSLLLENGFSRWDFAVNVSASNGYSSDPCLDFWTGVVCSCSNSTMQQQNHLHDAYYGYDDLVGYDNDTADACHITKLVMIDYGLSSSFPWTALASLPKLYKLHLSKNQLTGALDDTLSTHATNLTTLDLGANSFTGTLPSSWSNLTALTLLNINENTNIRGAVPPEFCTLSQLTALSVTDTQVTSLPTCINELASLRFLFAHKTLVGARAPGNSNNGLPDTLFSTVSLEILDLAESGVEKNIIDFFTLTNLKVSPS